MTDLHYTNDNLAFKTVPSCVFHLIGLNMIFTVISGIRLSYGERGRWRNFRNQALMMFGLWLIFYLPFIVWTILMTMYDTPKIETTPSDVLDPEGIDDDNDLNRGSKEEEEEPQSTAFYTSLPLFFWFGIVASGNLSSTASILENFIF